MGRGCVRGHRAKLAEDDAPDSNIPFDESIQFLVLNSVGELRDDVYLPENIHSGRQNMAVRNDSTASEVSIAICPSIHNIRIVWIMRRYLSIDDT